MNAHQLDLHNLQIKIEGKINECFPARTRTVQADAKKLKNFIKEQIADLILKEDFQSVRDTVLISTENPKSREQVKERVSEIIGKENISGIAELKNNRGEKSNYKIDFIKQKTVIDNENSFPIGKFFKKLDISNRKNKQDKFEVKPYIPKRFLTFSSRINLIAKDIRQERKDLGAEKLLTKTHVNFREQKLELRLKLKGQKKFVELDQFEATGFDKAKWSHKFMAMKKESYKEIYESIGLNVENSNSKTERKTGNKNRRNYEKISMIERNCNVTEDDFDSN